MAAPWSPMVAPPLPVVYDPEKVGEQFDADHPWELAELPEAEETS